MALIEGALLFLQVKIIFNISINKATDIVTTEIDYYKVPHLLQYACDSAADVEQQLEQQWRATIRVDRVSH